MSRPDPAVAIVGMACQFRSAAGLDTYWRNVISNRATGPDADADQPDLRALVSGALANAGYPAEGRDTIRAALILAAPNGASAAAIADQLRISGPNYVIDAEDASTLLALDAGVRNLLAGTCDLAIVGAMQDDPSAEGAGAIVLKRRDAALSSGDRLYATLAAIGIGKSDAADDPTHGIALMESVESAVPELCRRFGKPERTLPACALDANGVGVAAVIKAALALYHKVLPPSNSADPRSMTAADPPFYMNPAPRPWIHGNRAALRRAGVSFINSGLEAHAVLEEAPEADECLRETYLHEWDSEVFILSADSRAALAETAARLAEFLAADRATDLKDLAYTLNVETHRAPCRLAIVASTSQDLKEKLERSVSKLIDPKARIIRDPSGIYFYGVPANPVGKLAFIFPGEGSQYANMLADLCIHFPQVRQRFDRFERVLAGTELRPSEFLFPSPSWTDANATRLADLDAAILSILTADFAFLDLMTSLHLCPDAMVGHSAGEFVSVVASGMLGEFDAATAERYLSELWQVHPEMQRAPGLSGAALAAIGTDVENVSAVIEQIGAPIRISNENCSLQTVICGEPRQIERAIREFQTKGILCERLEFDRPYHTPEFRPFIPPLQNFFRRWLASAPKLPVYSCASKAPFPSDLQQIQELATEHWLLPVAFRSTIERMYADGVRIFVEVGPRGNLTQFVADILRGRPHVAVAANQEKRSGITQLNHLVALLFSRGLDPDLRALYFRRAPRTVNWNRRTEKKVAAAATALIEPQHAPHSSEVGTPPPQQVMAAHLSRMEEFLQTQSRTMLDYLSARPLNRTAAVFTAPAANTPMLQAIKSVVPGSSAIAVTELDVKEHLFLRDHTFGRDVSTTDPDLTGIPVLPLTMSMEIMAEAAALIFPQYTICSLRNVRGNKWIAPETGPIRLRVTAETSRDGNEPEVRVQIHEVRDTPAAGPEAPLAEATVGFSRNTREAPASLQRAAARPPALSRDRIYADLMFHGPSFQAVRSVDAVAQDSVNGIVDILPRNRLLGSDPDPHFVLDPVALDAISQVLGCGVFTRWPDSLFFPFGFEVTEFFGPPPSHGELRCHATAEMTGAGQLQAHLEAVREDGRVWCRATGWKFRRFPMPRPMLKYWLSCRDATLSESWKAPTKIHPDAGALVARRLDLSSLPRDLTTAASGMWLRTLAACVLNVRERQFWREAKFSQDRRIEWLCGRIVAKEALRQYLQERHGLRLCPADIEIQRDERGRPVVARGRWAAGLTQVPAVSIAHAGGVAVALVGDGSRGVGVDIEPVGRLDRMGTAESGGLVLSAEEESLLEPLALDPGALRLQVWCAKEAAAKSLGIGLGSGLLSMRARTVEIAGEHAIVRVGREPSGPLLTAVTARDNNIIFAIAQATSRETQCQRTGIQS